MNTYAFKVCFSITSLSERVSKLFIFCSAINTQKYHIQ